MTLDLRALLRALAEADVRYLVVGGVAVAAHGYVRATEDVDLVPDPENLRRLANALEARLPTAADRPFEARDLTSGRNITLDTPLGGIDIVQRVTGLPSFAVLDESAIASDVEGVPCESARSSTFAR